MTKHWAFDPTGPEFQRLIGPVTLARGMGLPARPGLYVITCGDCMPHVGTSSSIGGRVRTLANLGTHRGSAEVLCAAFCAGEAPMVWWEELGARRRHVKRKKTSSNTMVSPRNRARSTRDA